MIGFGVCSSNRPANKRLSLGIGVRLGIRDLVLVSFQWPQCVNVTMDERPFWFHPDANTEVLSAHDRYAEVTNELAERFQNELERSR